MAEAGIICSQILLTIFNVIQFIFGWILIICGAVIKVNGEIGGSGIAIFLIVIGSILVVVSIMGCVGAWTKNFCLLVTFCVFTSIIFILVVIALAIAFATRSKSEEMIESLLTELIKQNDTTAFESFQTEFKCCGVNDYTDWKKNEKYSKVDYLPPSCCGEKEGQCLRGNPKFQEKGCKLFVVDILKKSLTVMGGVTAACAIVMLIVIIVAAWLAHTIRGSYHAV